MYRDIDPRDPIGPTATYLAAAEAAHGERPSASRSTKPRDVFTRDLDLPRGAARERVRRRRPGVRAARLRGADAGDGRGLPCGACGRAAAARRPRRTCSGRTSSASEPRSGSAPCRTSSAGSARTLVTLTERGREVLEASLGRATARRRQEFYAGIAKPRELAHDVAIHQAYRDAAERLAAERRAGRSASSSNTSSSASIRRSSRRPTAAVGDADGRPAARCEEIARWAQRAPAACGR